MLAGGVTTGARAPAFEIERALSVLAPLGGVRGVIGWEDADVRLAGDAEASLHVHRERPDRVLLIDGRLHALPDAAAGPDHPLFAAWDRWGADGFDRMAGDAVCVMWDGRARRLVLARDSGGQRGLYYWAGPGQILFATEPRGILADPRAPRALDEDFLAEWIAILPRPSTRTAFAGVHRVPPGHALVWQDGRTTLHRFWRPEDRPMLRLARDNDYAEAVREALRQAVVDTLAGADHAGCHLSGGLDSSSVTAFAAEILGEKGRRLAAFTAVPGRSSPAGYDPSRFHDEWPLAAATARRHPNIDHVPVANDAQPLMATLQRRTAAMDCPVRNPSHAVWLDEINAEARRRQVDVLLSAGAGNAGFSYDGAFAAADLLRRGRLPALWRLLTALRQGEGRSWPSLAAMTLDPLVPAPVKNGARRLAGRRGPLRLYEHSAIDPAFARASGIERKSARLAGDLRNLVGLDSVALRLALMDRADHRNLWRSATRRLHGVDVRDPMADRRLIDLCFSIPEEQFAKGGRLRSIARRAMAGHLPAEVLAERRRGLQSADWPAGLTAARAEFAAEVARLAASAFARRLIDIPRLERMIADWPEGGWSRHEVVWGYLSGLNRAVAVGHFIRRIEGGNG